MNALAFGLPALVIVISGLCVTFSRDLVRSVLWLALVLFSTAILFITLRADFIAAVQVLLYTGGVVTLMLFGIMLTHRLEGARLLHETHGRGRAAVVCTAIFAIMVSAILQSPLPEPSADPAFIDTAQLGEAFLTEWLLPFEVLSMLLLAVMIGAIVLARKKDAT
jgi:NADH-quinone oxidoreductase subunit J